jgi:NADH-quinone oxidoreductase subunit M
VGGVVLMMVAHGLSVALLFLLATSVYHRAHTFALDEMGGLAQKTPVLAALFVAAIFASIGLPGFANFWGELTIFVALWKFSPLITALTVAGVVLSAIYGLRAAANVFFGPATERMTDVATRHPPWDLRWAEKFPALVLLAGLLFLGFWPKSMSEPINATLATMKFAARPVQVGSAILPAIGERTSPQLAPPGKDKPAVLATSEVLPR